MPRLCIVLGAFMLSSLGTARPFLGVSFGVRGPSLWVGDTALFDDEFGLQGFITDKDYAFRDVAVELELTRNLTLLATRRHPDAAIDSRLGVLGLVGLNFNLGMLRPNTLGLHGGTQISYQAAPDVAMALRFVAGYSGFSSEVFFFEELYFNASLGVTYLLP